MQTKKDNQIVAEKQQIYLLRFAVLNTLTCGPNVRNWAFENLAARKQNFANYIRKFGHSTWFYGKFVDKVGTFGGISFQVTIDGDNIQIDSILVKTQNTTTVAA